VRIVLALLLVASPARAERYVMQRGETLEHVAAAHGCSVETLQRANNVKTTLIKAGTAIEVPRCSLRTRARSRTLGTSTRKPGSEEDKARAALAVIDGATWTAATVDDDRDDPDDRAAGGGPRDGDPTDRKRGSRAERSTARGPGVPWNGELRGAERLPGDEGYLIRRPSRAYGASHVIDHLRGAIAVVRALYPDVHTLAIGDLSAEHGGKLDNHRSHQTGLDVDVGFYFRRVPAGYPDRFAPADASLDIAATWALLTAFARTTALDDGVEIIFLDHAVQRRLHDWAHARGTPDADLAALLQYPRSKDTQVGLVRHWPNHADHLHVRFKSGRR
jgi:murein endopeptidase